MSQNHPRRVSIEELMTLVLETFAKNDMDEEDTPADVAVYESIARGFTSRYERPTFPLQRHFAYTLAKPLRPAHWPASWVEYPGFMKQMARYLSTRNVSVEYMAEFIDEFLVCHGKSHENATATLNKVPGDGEGAGLLRVPLWLLPLFDGDSHQSIAYLRKFQVDLTAEILVDEALKPVTTTGVAIEEDDEEEERVLYRASPLLLAFNKRNVELAQVILAKLPNATAHIEDTIITPLLAEWPLIPGTFMPTRTLSDMPPRCRVAYTAMSNVVNNSTVIEAWVNECVISPHLFDIIGRFRDVVLKVAKTDVSASDWFLRISRLLMTAHYQRPVIRHELGLALSAFWFRPRAWVIQLLCTVIAVKDGYLVEKKRKRLPPKDTNKDQDNEAPAPPPDMINTLGTPVEVIEAEEGRFTPPTPWSLEDLEPHDDRLRKAGMKKSSAIIYNQEDARRRSWLSICTRVPLEIMMMICSMTVRLDLDERLAATEGKTVATGAIIKPHLFAVKKPVCYLSPESGQSTGTASNYLNQYKRFGLGWGYKGLFSNPEVFTNAEMVAGLMCLFRREQGLPPHGVREWTIWGHGYDPEEK